jgi:tRNA pseudouridine55 synthase
MKPDSPWSGILVVDKPQGPTSHTIVQWVRRALHVRKVGHAGTLDPLATGVLVLGVGRATKALQGFTADDKEYTAEVTLGVETDTLDAEGRQVKAAPVPEFSDDDLQSVARTWTGEVAQTVPVFSAVKQQGEALYRRARRGELVETPTRVVHIHSLALRRLDANRVHLHCVCSKGTYVRSLARDVAYGLGTVGHVTALRRLRSGTWSLDHAIAGSVLIEARAGSQTAVHTIQSGLRPVSDSVTSLTPVATTPYPGDASRESTSQTPVSPSALPVQE